MKNIDKKLELTAWGFLLLLFIDFIFVIYWAWHGNLFCRFLLCVFIGDVIASCLTRKHCKRKLRKEGFD